VHRLIDLERDREGEWQGFAAARGTVFHSLAWKRVLEESFGYTGRYLALVDGEDRIAGLLPLMVGRNLRLARVAVSLPFVNYLDLCCRDDAARAALIGFLGALPQRLGVRSVELRLLDGGLACAGASVDRSNATFVLPLEGGEEGLLAACSASNRNHVRKVYRRETFTADTDPSNLDVFYAIHARRQKQLGSPVPDVRFFRRIREALPEQTALLTVRVRETGTPAAAMFLFSSGDTLHYAWGGSDVAYHREYVNVFMYWEAVRYGIARGHRWLDLGRSSRLAANSGTYVLKEQFGAVAKPLSYWRFGAGGASMAEQRTQLAGAVALWKRLPAVLTDPFGALLVRYVLP
jgi:hypothetical protein